MKSIIVKTAGLLLVFTLLCGGVYTALVTGAAQAFFPDRANGSLIEADGKSVGSRLLGQPFSGSGHLWGRAASPDVDAFSAEDGAKLFYAWPTNFGVSSADYGQLIKARIGRIRAMHPEMGDAPVPVELVTGSGSGLDPDLSIGAAKYQAKRVAAQNGLTEAAVLEIFEKCLKLCSKKF